MFDAYMLQVRQQELLLNPPPAVKPAPTKQELAAKRNAAIVDARATQYQEEQAKAEAESKRAQARGATAELLRHLGATKEEQRQLSRCPVSEVPAALADIRRPAPANMEVLEKIYSVLK